MDEFSNGTEHMLAIEREEAAKGWYYERVGERSWFWRNWKRLCLFAGIVGRLTACDYRLGPGLAWEIASDIFNKSVYIHAWVKRP